MRDIQLINLLALAWFIALWVGYTWFSVWLGRRRNCLAGELHQLRLLWMANLLRRDNRVPDTTIIANLERSVTFFASSTMLIIAGLLTVLASTDRVMAITSALPWVQEDSLLAWELKLMSLVVLFVFAFFKFSWSLRQVGFCSVLAGAAPMPEDEVSEVRRLQYAEGAAEVLSLAGYQFNLGLRSYYFGLAMLAWFINPWVFMLASLGVVVVLYSREFHSNTLTALLKSAPSKFSK